MFGKKIITLILYFSSQTEHKNMKKKYLTVSLLSLMMICFVGCNFLSAPPSDEEVRDCLNNFNGWGLSSTRAKFISIEERGEPIPSKNSRPLSTSVAIPSDAILYPIKVKYILMGDMTSYTFFGRTYVNGDTEYIRILYFFKAQDSMGKKGWHFGQ